MLKRIEQLIFLVLATVLSVHAQVHYVAVGGSGVLITSSDGITWTQRTSSFGTNEITSVAYGNGLWVAAGRMGQSASSPDGITWTQRARVTSYGYLFAMVFANGKWVVAGDCYEGQSPCVFYSTDLSSAWKSSSTGLSANKYIVDVAYGGGRFVVGRDNGMTNTSGDGVTWINQTSVPDSGALHRVFYANGLWLAGGDYYTLGYSTNAVNWTRASVSFVPYSFAYGNGKWIAGGQSGAMASSADGMHWTRYDSGLGTGYAWDMLFDGSKYVTVGNNGLIATSTDGVAWTKQTSPVAGIFYYKIATDLVAAPPVNHTYVVIAND